VDRSRASLNKAFPGYLGLLSKALVGVAGCPMKFDCRLPSRQPDDPAAADNSAGAGAAGEAAVGAQVLLKNTPTGIGVETI